MGSARLVVVKEIHAALSRDASFAQMFIDEAKLCAGLRHANVVQVVDLGREGDALYMAMEYVEGLDLSQLLRRLSQQKIALPAEFALFVVREVLGALDFAHRATDASGKPLGIVHRDVSPSNVLMSLEGEVKLCDFGIARAMSADEQPGAEPRARVVGKAAYMSPEHARGEALDARADVFAAGILLWELCAGRRLYKGSEDEMLELARRGEVPPLPDRGLAQHARLAEIVARALAPDREQRFASARELRDALEDYAVATRLFASQIRFGAFLTDNFGVDLVLARRARERAARALEKGPPVVLSPLPPETSSPGELDVALDVDAPESAAMDRATGPGTLDAPDLDAELEAAMPRPLPDHDATATLLDHTPPTALKVVLPEPVSDAAITVPTMQAFADPPSAPAKSPAPVSPPRAPQVPSPASAPAAGSSRALTLGFIALAVLAAIVAAVLTR